MATVDLAQLPPPQIIEVLDFEVILADVKAVMIAAFPDEQQASVYQILFIQWRTGKNDGQCFFFRHS